MAFDETVPYFILNRAIYDVHVSHQTYRLRTADLPVRIGRNDKGTIQRASATQTLRALHGMGATASSLHEQRIATDLAAIKGCMPDAATPIDWSREASVEAHSIINTLKNCLHHRRSARTKKLAVRLPCTSRAPSAPVVSFDPLPIDIDTSTPFHTGSAKREMLSVHQRVPTGGMAARAGKRPEPSDEMWEGASISSSMRSLDSTVPREETDETTGSHPDCGDGFREQKAFWRHRVETTYEPQADVDYDDICELLTSGSSTKNCSPVDFCDMATSGGSIRSSSDVTRRSSSDVTRRSSALLASS